MRARIETQRLVLRPYTYADADRVYEILSDERVYPWLDDPPHQPMASSEAARASIDRWAASEAEDSFTGFRAVEIKESGLVAGTVLMARLERNDGGFVGEYEVGWHLAPDCWGHGYAAEAAEAFLDAMFADGIDEVWCGMYPHNEASQKVAEQLRLPFVGVQDDPWYDGDSRLYRVNRDEWSTR